MYLVAIEDKEDGTWFDDPHGFDSEDQAMRYIREAVSPPEGYECVLYRCFKIQWKD